MLGKLLKYDLKWIYKVVAVFYVLAIIFSIIGRLLKNIENSVVFSVIAEITIAIAISMMASSLINCIMRLWARFIKNLYKDESYLMHTLPVKKKTIYIAKTLCAIITVFTTTAVIISCLFICYYSDANIEMIKKALELAASTYNTTVINLLLIISLAVFVEIMFIVLIGYTAIVLGHKSNQNKILKSVIIAFALYMITQIVSVILIVIFGLFSQDVMNLINTTESISIETIKAIMIVAITVYAIYSIFYYILGKKQFEKGVNVE